MRCSWLPGALCCRQRPTRRRLERGNTTSLVGFAGTPYQPIYAAAKLGIVRLTRALATEGARDSIHVNAVIPSAATVGRLEARAFSVERAIEARLIPTAPAQGRPSPKRSLLSSRCLHMRVVAGQARSSTLNPGECARSSPR